MGNRPIQRLGQAAHLEGMWTVIGLIVSGLTAFAAFFTGLGHAGYAWAIPAAAVTFPAVLLAVSMLRGTFSVPLLGISPDSMPLCKLRIPDEGVDAAAQAILTFPFQNFGGSPVKDLVTAFYLTDLDKPSSSDVASTTINLKRHTIMPGAPFSMRAKMDFDGDWSKKLIARTFRGLALVQLLHRGRVIAELWLVLDATEEQAFRMAMDQEIEAGEDHLKAFISMARRGHSG